MCGILGIYAFKSNHSHHPEFFTYGFENMKHRGPDAHAQKNYGTRADLGHLRLSIIDTSEQANMPMETDRSAIIFNGEVYNYLELKSELSDVEFHTTSDTEVLQRGLERHGEAFLNRLNGMFAFALYDKEQESLLLVRDRFGVKPLYYLEQDGRIYFSSEIKPLAHVKAGLKKNDTVYRNFIVDTASDYNAETGIEGIKQVERGQYLVCTPDGITRVKWYSGNDFDVDPGLFSHHKDTLRFFEDLLTHAVQIRLRSDVPVCITLSGGLDSTVLYTLMKERIGASITPFTFVNPGSDVDEVSIAERLATYYGDTVRRISSDHSAGVEDMQEALRSLEFPSWGASAIAYMDMYKAIAAQGFTVVLEGHGSDEQLGGYPFMIQTAASEFMRHGQWWKALQAVRVYRATEKWHTSDSIPAFHNAVISTWERSRDANFKPFSAVRDLTFDYTILPIVLRTFDRLTMNSSLESRSPFMDYRVVEFLKALPLEYTVTSIGSKALLREMLKKYGHDFIYNNKPKQGFSLDEPKFFNQPRTRAYFSELIAQFNMLEYEALKRDAEQFIKAAPIEWKHAGTLWKIGSLSYINTFYGI